MLATYKILSDLCRVITESIDSQEAVDKALFTYIHPFTAIASRLVTIEDTVENYYDRMFHQQWTIDTIQNKVRSRTKELITKIENCISDDLIKAYNRIEILKIDEVDREVSLPRARLVYTNRNHSGYFNFDSYRLMRSVSTLEEMSEIPDFKTKQIVLKLRVVKTFEGIVNAILKNLARADIISSSYSVKYWSPYQCLDSLNSIRAYCSNSYIPEHAYLYDDKTLILQEYCEKDKQRRAQLLLDNVYNDLRLRQLDKQDVCAIIYLLFEKRHKLGFKKDVLNKFTQFKEKIYEYYRLTPSTYKINQIVDRADEFRNKGCIMTI